jgi:hypothetical protein
MRFYTRMLVCVAAAVLLSAVLFNFAVSCFDGETSVLRLGRLLVLESRRSEAMDARAETVLRSMDIKRDIIFQLLAGRLQLREAIAEFHKANEMIENDHTNLMATYQLPSDREGVGQQVLAWACRAVDALPSDKGQRRLAELEYQYQKLFGRPSSPDSLQTTDLLPIGCCAG